MFSGTTRVGLAVIALAGSAAVGTVRTRDPSWTDLSAGSECMSGQYDNPAMANEYSLEGCISPTTCPPCEPDPVRGCEPCAIDLFTAELGLTPVGYSDWHLYSPTCSGTVEIHTCDTLGTLEEKIDSLLGLYGSVGTQTQGDVGLLVSNDEGCEPEPGGADAFMLWNVEFGETYGVRVAGFASGGGGDGDYTLTFVCHPSETASVPAGASVTAEIGGGATTVGGVSMTFENVEQTGDVSADFAEVPPDYESLATINFQLPGDPTQVWNLAFDGTFTGSVELDFAYNDDSLLVPETDLEVYHLVGDSWSALAKIGQDTAANTITVETGSFSLFALGVPADPVPSVGAWGLVALVLLILSAASVVILRLPDAAPAQPA